MPNAKIRPRPLSQSLQEYGRGVAGGLLFSLPLLYTMEVWWQGFIASPQLLLLYLFLSFIILLGYNRFSGMRRDASFLEVIIDSVEELGMGLVIAAGVLFLLGRITADMPLHEILGKTVVEGMTVAIGVSIGTAQLGLNQEEDTGIAEEKEKKQTSGKANSNECGPPPNTWGQLILGFCGAILIGSNIAPTEEIVQIAIETSPEKLLGLAILSLAACAVILFYIEFVGSRHHVRRGAWFWVGYGVVSSYALSLLASALMLSFFGRFSGASLGVICAQTVVLAFPAVLGASAGRLLIQ